jgi:Leucine-rich repeat (LRR) protein
MFSIAKLTAMKRLVSLPSIVWIGLVMVLSGWQSLAQAETDCSTVTEIPTAQCEDLVALYDSTDGDNWKNNTDWKQTNTPCSWYGIKCGNGAVTQIDLRSNQLTGSIPDFSAFTNLQTLSLDSNQLSGSIPDFSALTNLQNLYFRNNQLSGSIR